MVDRLGSLGGDGLYIVYRGRNNLGKRSTPASNSGGSDSNSGGFSRPQSIKQNLLNARLWCHCLSIGIDYWTVANFCGFQSSYCNNFKAGAAGENISEFSPSKFNYRNFGCHWNQMGNSDKVRYTFI